MDVDSDELNEIQKRSILKNECQSFSPNRISNAYIHPE